MSSVLISARISKDVKDLASNWCKANGFVMAKFIEEAMIEKLEEHIDSQEIDKLRKEPTRAFSAILKELKGVG
jgi:uncharacterized protein (DUF1778 family)